MSTTSDSHTIIEKMGNTACVVEPTVNNENRITEPTTLFYDLQESSVDCNATVQPELKSILCTQKPGSYNAASNLLLQQCRINFTDLLGNIVDDDMYIDFTQIINAETGVFYRLVLPIVVPESKEMTAFSKVSHYISAYEDYDILHITFNNSYYDNTNIIHVNTYDLVVTATSSDLNQYIGTWYIEDPVQPFFIYFQPPHQKITIHITLTDDKSDLSKVTYQIYDYNKYQYTTRLTTNPQSHLTQSVLTIHAPDIASCIWVQGTTLRNKLDTLRRYSAEFSDSGFIGYALIKYALIAIIYGRFDTVYLTPSLHHQFIKDLKESRFNPYIEYFEGPKYKVTKYHLYFSD